MKRSSSAGCLFQFVTPDGYKADEKRSSDGERCGCISQIHEDQMADGGFLVAWTNYLTDAICADDRLPSDIFDLFDEFSNMTEDAQRDALEPFADLQRLVDATIRN